MAFPPQTPTRSPTRSPTYVPTAWKWGGAADAPAAGVARQFMLVDGFHNTDTTTTQQYITPAGMINEA
jgi:hypothetical protein